MEINKDNYKDWLVRYFEDDLNTTEKVKAEQFINDNEWASQELELLKRTRLKPNMEIRFPDKRLLFRTEEPVVELKRPVVVFKMYRYAALAAAAALLAFAIIFSIRKQDNSIETAHSELKKEILPPAKIPEQVQTMSPNQPTHVLANETKGIGTKKETQSRGESGKRTLMANNSPSKQTQQKEVQKRITNLKTWKDPGQTIDVQYASEAAKEKTDQEFAIPAPKTQELATIVKQPVAQTVKAVPVKAVSNTEYDDPTLLQSLFSLLHKVSIKKEEVNKQTYYALSIETPNIKVNKTIKSIIQ